MITGKIKTAAIELGEGNSLLVLEIREFHRTIKVSSDQQGIPVFDLILAVNGAIAESRLGEEELVKQLNNEIRQQAIEQIEKVVSGVIQKSQKEYKTDFLGFGKKLYERRYDLWNKYERDWEEGENIYSQSKINVHVELKVETFGTITKIH